MNTRILFFLLIASTCVPALLCAQQQEDQLFALTRMEPAKGRADAAQEQLKKMSLAYYANGLDLPTYWNRYDDGTLEVVHPVRDYAKLDRVDALFDFAYGSMDSTERKVNFDRQLFSKNVPIQEAKLLRLHYDKSYLPEQENEVENDYSRLLLYDIRPGIARSEVYEHARKLVAMLEEVKSPVRVNFYTYDMGENNRRIEIELDAPDAATLRKQQQESERLLGDRLTEWRKERDRLAEQVGSHELTYLRDMSQEAQPETFKAFVLQTVVPEEGATNELLKIRKQLSVLSREGKDDLYFDTYRMDNGEIRFQSPIERMSDIDRIYDKVAARNYKLDSTKFKPLREQFGKLVESNKLAVVVQPQDLHYVPEGVDMAEYTTVRHQEMTFDQQDAGEVRELAAEIVRINKERNATVPFSVYFYDFGGESNRMFVQDYGTSRAQLEQGRQKDHELMAGEEYDSWSARVEELLRPVTVTYGELVPEASHQPSDAGEDTK